MQRFIAILCAVTLPGATTYALAQDPMPAPQPEPQQQQLPQQQQAPLLAPQQLDNLVAPIALYPDPLLGQVLAASTYPLEIVEAQQFVQQHPELRGQALADAARQQPWDPSVQALVAFPEAMAMLTRDIQWTTDLGNAFLAQQADVMAAIQQMRMRAQQNGRLQSNPQETVTQQPVNGGPPAIQIQPANPQVIYVPQYNPVYVWGPPVYGAYPPLWYPSINLGFIFGPAIFLGSIFAGFLGFGGWGWGLNWLAHGLFLNTLFFHHFGFGGFGAGFYGRGGMVAWAHDPAHRLGVAYPNHALAARYGAASRMAARRYTASRAYNGASRGYAGNFSARSYSSNQFHSFSGNERSYAGSNASRGYSAPASRGYSAGRSYSSGETARGEAARSFSNSSRASSNRYSAPRSNERTQSQHFSAPKSSGGSHFSSRSSGGGRSSGGHSSGGHASKGHSGGGKKH